MKHVSLKRPLMAIALAAALAAGWPAAAHHSFAMYEPTKTLTFKGTVKSFQWTNPHVVVWVLVMAVLLLTLFRSRTAVVAAIQPGGVSQKRATVIISAGV